MNQPPFSEDNQEELDNRWCDSEGCSLSTPLATPTTLVSSAPQEETFVDSTMREACVDTQEGLGDGICDSEGFATPPSTGLMALAPCAPPAPYAPIEVMDTCVRLKQKTLQKQKKLPVLHRRLEALFWDLRYRRLVTQPLSVQFPRTLLPYTQMTWKIPIQPAELWSLLQSSTRTLLMRTGRILCRGHGLSTWFPCCSSFVVYPLGGCFREQLCWGKFRVQFCRGWLRGK